MNVELRIKVKDVQNMLSEIEEIIQIRSKTEEVAIKNIYETLLLEIQFIKKKYISKGEKQFVEKMRF